MDVSYMHAIGLRPKGCSVKRAGNRAGNMECAV